MIWSILGHWGCLKGNLFGGGGELGVSLRSNMGGGYTSQKRRKWLGML